MAYTASHQAQPTPLTGFIGRILLTVFNVLIRIAENHPRYKKMKRLSEMTDAELAEIGLRRDGIARHVLSGTL